MQEFLTNVHLPSLLRASWQAAVLILLVLVVQWALGARLSPRWRYALWLLVAARLALPWTISSPISVFNLVSYEVRPSLGAATWESNSAEANTETPELPAIAAPGDGRTPTQWLLLTWLAGAVVLGGWLALTHYRLWRRVTPRRPLIDTRVLNLLEDCKQMMGLRVPVTLVETPAVGSPSLFGFVRPRLLLPAGLATSFSEEELRHVFLHELSHIKRRDILVGWLMTALQILHWFNPLVWVAFHRMRVDRELACDALALSYAKEEENRPYGRTIIKLLESFGGSAWAPSLAGTVENRNQMKERISMIAQFRRTHRVPAMAGVLFIVLAMVTLTDAQTRSKSTARAAGSGPVPNIIATSPAVGATDVDPGTKEITVTFDQDMGRGMSWTGGGPEFPPIPEGQRGEWRDKRTCVLPVKLEAGRFYRVGINSTSYRNFSSAARVPARPSAIYFTTQGADEAMKAKVQVPKVASLEPANGAQDVDPGLKELRVTFDVPMGGGMSWCTGDDKKFPKDREGKRAQWTDDGKTCVMPVELSPGVEYELWLNSENHKNFQSAGGVPIKPVRYTFRTANQ